MSISKRPSSCFSAGRSLPFIRRGRRCGDHGAVDSQISAHQSGIVHAVLEVIATLLAITVVRGLTARAEERLRRMSV